jgi:hypothetical protein
LGPRSEEGHSRRLEAPALRLVLDAAGSPRALARKARALVSAVRAVVDRDALAARLERLERLGRIERAPTRLQLVAGSVDMLRFWIVPGHRDYCARRGISFALHQILRVLDDPSSMIDPTGLGSSRDTIIGHLMQVVHANPRYDLELLESHPGGLEELEAQLIAMLAGEHPRARAILAIVEEPDYHTRLLEYVRAYRCDRETAPPLRENVADDPRLSELDRTFGALAPAMRYFASLPSTWPGVLAHLATARAPAEPR